MKATLRRCRGITLIESAVVTAIVAIVLGSAAPGFGEALQRRHLDGVAAQLETDLQFARADAVARHVTVRIDFARDAAGSCYVIHTGAAGDCRCDGQGRTSCRPGLSAWRTVHLADPARLRLQSNVASMAFDGDRGTVTPTATLKLVSPLGSLHHVVNVMGRVRSCSPAPGLPGHRAC